MDLSIVVPCYNEEKNIPVLAKEISEVLKEEKRSFEVLFIDDGSTDNTMSSVKNVCLTFSFARGFYLMRNYGQTAAYQAGFDNSKGKYVIIISADLEVPTGEIVNVIKKLDAGYDFVNTNRIGRYKQNTILTLVKGVPSKMANYITGRLANVKVVDTGSGLKGLKRILVDNMKIYGDMHRFLPAYASMYGAKICEIDVLYKPRIHGKSYYGKFGLGRTFKVILDLISLKFLMSFSTKPFTMMPIRFFGGIGILFGLLGTFFGIYLSFAKIILGQNIGNRPLLQLSVLLILLGFQFVMMGLLGELMLRTYYESQNKKTYTVRETS